MLHDVLSRGFDALVLTNAMKPMRKLRPQLLALRNVYGARLRIRVSLDHYAPEVHEAERGRRSWAPTIDGLVWLARNGFAIDVAGRRFSGEPEADLRAGFARLFAELDVPIDAADPVRLMLFPEMDAQRDVPEITTACWGILHKSPDDVMCASARMVVKRKGRRSARGAGLHAAGIRSAVRAWPHAGRGSAAGIAQPSLLRVVLRARAVRPAAADASRVPGGARQQQRIDVELAQRAAPLRVVVAVEHDGLVGRHRQPRILLDLGIELARSPAGIAQRQQTLARSVALGDRLQHVEAGGQRHRVVDAQAALAGPVRGVQHEAARVVHRAAGAQPYPASRRHRRDLELPQQIVELGTLQRAIEHQAHRAFRRMRTEIDDALGKARILHRRHRDQQLPGQEIGAERTRPWICASEP